MSGFQSGVEGGVKSAFSNIGKIVGLAFGAKEAFDFGKSIISGAAQLQKSAEVIKSEFGAASKSVTAFGEKGAAALGISAQNADAASAKFGILFKNIGIGPQKAADMTLGFEKLAGSLSAIKGTDPSQVLQSIVLAAAGNARGLKQLGIVVDGTTEKVAAFKLGLIGSVTDALTPAEKAQAIYAIATSHLAQFQEEAAAHAGDLTNVQRKLSAEWSNAKDALGAGLLPAVTTMVKFFAGALPVAIDATRTAFKDLAADVRGIASGIGSVLGPALKPIETAFKEIREAFKGGGTDGIAEIKAQFEHLSPAAKGVVIAIGLVTAAIGALVIAAFPITAAVAAVIGLGIAFREAYTHSAKFRQIVGEVGAYVTGTLIPGFEGIVKKAAPAFAQLYQTAKKAFDDIKVDVQVVVGVIEELWARFGGTIKTVLKTGLDGAVRVVQDVLKEIGGVFDIFTGILTGKWGKVWGGIKTVVGAGLDAAKTVIEGWGTAIEDIFGAIWKSVELIFLEGIKKSLGVLEVAYKALTLDVGGLLGAVGIHVGDPVNSLKKTLDGLIASVKAGRKDIGSTWDIAGFTGAWVQQSKDQRALKGVTSGIAAAIAAAMAGGAKSGADAAGTAIADGLGTTKTLISGGFKTAVSTGVSTGIDSGVAAAQQSLASLQTSLKQAVAKEATDITASVQKAKANLITIGSSLATSIGTALDQPLTVASQNIQDATDKISAQFDALNSPLAAAAAKLSYTQAKITDGFDKLTAPLDAVAAKLSYAQAKIAQGYDASTAKLSAAAAKLSLAQSKLGLKTDEQSLTNLRSSFLLPGGKQLSSNNATALKQLQALAKSNNANRPVIEGFIAQFQGQLLQVAQDQNGIASQTSAIKEAAKTTPLALKASAIALKSQGLAIKEAAKLKPLNAKSEGIALFQQGLAIAQAAKESPLQLANDRIKLQQDATDKIKAATTRQIADLTAEFNKTRNIRKFTQGITRLLTQDHVSFKSAGKLLGSAFESGFREQAQGIFQQALAISKGPQRKGTGQESTIVRPLTTLAHDQAEIKRISTEIGNKQITLQQKILTAAQKTAAAAQAIHSVQLGASSKAIARNPGHQSKVANLLTGTTG